MHRKQREDARSEKAVPAFSASQSQTNFPSSFQWGWRTAPESGSCGSHWERRGVKPSTAKTAASSEPTKRPPDLKGESGLRPVVSDAISENQTQPSAASRRRGTRSLPSTPASPLRRLRGGRQPQFPRKRKSPPRERRTLHVRSFRHRGNNQRAESKDTRQGPSPQGETERSRLQGVVFRPSLRLHSRCTQRQACCEGKPARTLRERVYDNSRYGPEKNCWESAA